jgi:predicted permease
LQQGVTRERATADLGAVAAALHDAIPGAAWDGEFVDVLPAGRFATMQGVAPGLSLAAALTAIVLLAACANLGTLLLARGLAREREFAVRLSVGATRVRLARQLMTESVMLAAAGTVAALGVSFITARLLLAASDAPRFLEPRLDVPVLIFSIVIAAAAAALAGLTPAFQAVKPAASRARARGVLVAVQVGAGCTLLVVAALLARGIDRVLHAPLGFDYDAQLVIDPGLDAHGFTPQAARAYWNRLRIEVGALPAVRSVSLATLPPLGNRAMTTRLSNAATAYVHHIEPEYFRTMGIPLLRGRLFDAAERDVAIVSESFARVMWPGEDALGKEYDSAAVIGVVGNASTISPGNASAVELYRPIDDQHLAQAIMIVRVDGDPARRVGALAEAARRIDRRAPPSIASVARNFDAKLQPPRRASAAISALGVTALALAAIGFGGLIAFTVSQRTREIGIRLALGARRVHIISALLSQFTRPLALGVLGGLCGAATVAAVLRRELFGLNLFDPVSYAGAVALLLVAGTLAAAGPIRRALRVDPVSSLRCD